MAEGNFVNIEGLRLKKKVRAIVTNDDRQFLLIRPHGYKDNSWTFVGGGVEENETDLEALYRETQIFKHFRPLRDNLLTIPDRLDAELAATTDRHIVHKILYNEIVRVLDDANKPALKPKR